MNQAPQGVLDYFFYTVGDLDGVYQGAPVKIIDVLANDTDPNRRTADYESGRERLYIHDVDATGVVGQVIWDYSGIGYYADDAFLSLGAGQSTTETMTYTLTDRKGGFSTAELVILVTGVNDAPVAVDDAFAVSANSGPRLLMVAANDFDPDDLDSILVTGASGVEAIAGLFNGTYFDPGDHHAYLGAGETEVMTYRYTISDGGGLSDSAVVTLTVVGVNDAPEAAADAFAVLEDDGAVALDVLANDSDVDASDVLTVTGLELTGTRGAVSVAADGSGVSYAAAGAFEGLAAGQSTTDSFACTISDGQGGAATEIVTMTVTGVNDAPVAVADAFAATEDDPAMALDVLANDGDVDDGDVLTITAVDLAGVLGAVTISADGSSLAYAANGAFEGWASAKPRPRRSPTPPRTETEARPRRR